MINKTTTEYEILTSAISIYKPYKYILMVSGGHDSITNAHVTASILTELKMPFVVYHGDTTIGIPETQEYVKMICHKFGWDLFIRQPPNPKDHYDVLVEKYGFPGPTKSSHQLMYRRLKERALRAFVTHEMKSKPRARQNVLLATGVRKQESRIRMGYTHTYRKDASRIWCNPIFYWSERDCKDYMELHSIPKNPVKEKICISGECLCGAFAGKEEYAEICISFPEVGKRLKKLHEIATKNGFPWDWSSGPIEWAKKHPKNQTDMFMCVGCESKKSFLE